MIYTEFLDFTSSLNFISLHLLKIQVLSEELPLLSEHTQTIEVFREQFKQKDHILSQLGLFKLMEQWVKDFDL